MNNTESKYAEHAITFYDALLALSVAEQIENVKEPVQVFRGKVTEVYKGLGISMSYYSAVKRMLEGSGSLQYLRAGNKMQETCLLVLTRPTLENLVAVPPLTPARDPASIDRRVTALEERLGEMPIQRILIDFEQRLQALEHEASKVAGRKEQNGKNKK